MLQQAVEGERENSWHSSNSENDSLTARGLVLLVEKCRMLWNVTLRKTSLNTAKQGGKESLRQRRLLGDQSLRGKALHMFSLMLCHFYRGNVDSALASALGRSKLSRSHPILSPTCPLRVYVGVVIFVVGPVQCPLRDQESASNIAYYFHP